ncbi:hypothetical protein JCM3765_004737 [Sporobolomyces pararoseus]
MATAIEPSNLIPLLKLASISTSISSINSPPFFFQGYLISPPLYDPSSDSCIFSLVSPRPNRAIAVVEVKGKAGIQIKEKLKEKDKVCLSLKGAQVKEIESNQLPSVGIVFEQEVEGWIQRKLKKDEWFCYGNDLRLSSEPKSFENFQELPQNSLPTPPRQALSPKNSPNFIRNSSVREESPTKRKRLRDENSFTEPFEARPSKRSSISLDFEPIPPPITSIQPLEPPPVASTSKQSTPKRAEEPNVESRRASTQVPTVPAVQNPSLPLTRIPQPFILPKLASMPPPTNTREPPISVSRTWNLANLSDIKSGRNFAYNTSSFAVVVVEIGEVTRPRNGKKDDSYCARFEVTDPSIFSENEEIKRDSLDSIVQLQWYSHRVEDIPKFKQKDVILLRSFTVTNHPNTSLRCIRRYTKNTLPPYLLIPASTLLSSRQTDYSPLPFIDSKQVKSNQTEWELAKKLANCYSSKWFPTEDASFKELRRCVSNNTYAKLR